MIGRCTECEGPEEPRVDAITPLVFPNVSLRPFLAFLMVIQLPHETYRLTRNLLAPFAYGARVFRADEPPATPATKLQRQAYFQNALQFVQLLTKIAASMRKYDPLSRRPSRVALPFRSPSSPIQT